MPPLKQHPRLVRLTAALLIATVLQACTSWHARPLEPAQFSPSVHPGEARLILANGTKITVLGPVIRGDSLFSNNSRALALTSIRGVEVSQIDAAATFVLMVGLGLTALIIYAVATWEGPTFTF